MAVGQRPISNVVDITNYVMLLLGQPMHAYDLDRVAGPELHVRAAREGERLTTLDGEERVFDGDAVLVCDAEGPTGIGGIMGGAAQRGQRGHHPGRDGGGDLERHQHPDDVEEAGSAHRGQQPVREAVASPPRAPGAAPRGTADGGAVRRANGPRDGRRGGARAGAASRHAARRAARRAARASRSRPRSPRRSSSASASAWSGATATSRRRCRTSATTTSTARPT